MARAKRRTKATSAEPAINPFAAQHGDYGTVTVVDLTGELGGRRQSMVRLLRNMYPSIVDRWLAEGGPGFEEPERRAVEHCRSLWHAAGDCGRLVANFDYVGGGGGGRERDGWQQADALAQLSEYKKEFPSHVWDIFENIARHDFSIPQATAGLSSNKSQNQGYARACVGFVASKIAEWRRL